MHSQKIIVSATGVILFLLAGAAAMVFMPSDSHDIAHNISHDSQQDNTQKNITATQESIPQKESHEAMQQKLSALSPKVWYVYVTGAVKKPGVYSLPENSRVFKAIEAAGGFKPNADETSLNLAEFLTDSIHIHIPVKGQQNVQPSQNVRIPGLQSQTSINANNALININTASAQELERIKGVGPAIAKRIIDYRNSHGSFTKPEDLMKVKGIGNATFAKIRPQITIQGGMTSGNQMQISGVSTSSGGNNLIDINNANLQELQRIKGVGPATAQKIIDYRNSHGAFTKPEDLMNVRGIGASKLKQIRTQIIIR